MPKIRVYKMNESRSPRAAAVMAAVLLIATACPAFAAAATTLGVPGLEVQFHDAHGKPEEVATAIKLLALLTVLSLAPAIVSARLGHSSMIATLNCG